MEKKIGQIFERNGEWYQCVEHKGCHSCAFALSHGIGIRCGFNGDPHCAYRSDGKPVIFKKLEKVGEPYIVNNKARQKYKLHIPLTMTKEAVEKNVLFDDANFLIIGMEQNKEDMEQIEYFGDENTKCFNSESIEKNLKPFNLDAAKQGKPVCTRDGRKARIICFDRKDKFSHIVALITNPDGREIIWGYEDNGACSNDNKDNDLMMLPEKKEGWVNVYKGIDGVTFSKHPYTSKDEAIKKSGILFGRIDTIKVSWEE